MSPLSFTCPRCGRESWHPKDVEYGYCGFCHAYTGGERELGCSEDRHLAVVTVSHRARDLFRRRYWIRCWECDLKVGPFRWRVWAQDRADQLSGIYTLGPRRRRRREAS